METELHGRDVGIITVCSGGPGFSITSKSGYCGILFHAIMWTLQDVTPAAAYFHSLYSLLATNCSVVRRYIVCVIEIVLNPLMPELNPSAQRCLPRFFTADFDF
jgi:hypothetical protein